MAAGEFLWKNWAEVVAFMFLIIGFLVAISLESAAFVYIVIFLSGVLAGRYYFSKIRKQPLFPFFLIIIGLLIGYVIGSFNANRVIVVLLFFSGWVASHYIHKKGYIRI